MKLGNDIKRENVKKQLLQLLDHVNDLRSPLLTGSDLEPQSTLSGIYELLVCSEIWRLLVSKTE